MKPFMSLSVLLCFLVIFTSVANGALTNRTFDDFDDAITYLPENNWQRSNNFTCLDCLQPEPQFASAKTFHYGFHPNTGPDADDLPPGTGNLVDPDAGVNDDQDGKNDGDESTQPTPADKDHGKQKGKPRGAKGKRWLSKLLPRADSDDHDIKVSATIDFIGSAIYVFCILPTNVNNASALSTTNLTFILDGKLFPPGFQQKPHVISTSPTAFNYSMPPVFSVDNLDMTNHSLSVMPMIGSMVFLDKIIITEVSGDGTAGGATPNSTSSGIVDTETQGGHKKNVATFGIAIGTTMGVLAVVSFTVFLSICYRRRRSALPHKMREAREASLRPQSPEMRGLAQPFIPRYFPGSSPYRPPSIGTASSIGSRRNSSEGPSHGLNYPLAAAIPPYSAPSATPTSPPTISRVIAARPPVSRLPDDDDVIPPSYNEAQSMPLVTVPLYTLIAQPQPSVVSLSLAESSSPPLTVMSTDRSSITITPTSTSPLIRNPSAGSQTSRPSRRGGSPAVTEEHSPPLILLTEPPSI